MHRKSHSRLTLCFCNGYGRVPSSLERFLQMRVGRRSRASLRQPSGGVCQTKTRRYALSDPYVDVRTITWCIQPFLARAEQEKLKYEAARREYEESFSDSFEAAPDYSSGHFIGIEQLSLEDPFVISSAVPASPKISPSHVHISSSSSNNLKPSHRDSLTQEDFMDAFEETSKERMQY